MATLPASSNATNSSATEGQVKSWLASVRNYIAQQLGATGTQTESLQMLGTPFNSAISKSGAYTVVDSDRGKVICCTGTWTLSVSAVATLADGFVFAVMNEGSGTITVDPNLTEKVDGATTKSLPAGSFTVFYCDGVKLKSMGSIDSTAVIAALGYTPANQTSVLGKDVGHNNVGSFCLVVIWNGGNSVAIGSTVAGSTLRAAGMGYESAGYGFFATANTGAALSGTWRLLGAFNNISTNGESSVSLKNPMSLAQRIS